MLVALVVMIEMILAKLCDDGLDFSDYPEALQHFFTYIARTDFRSKIVFDDYYPVLRIDPDKILDRKLSIVIDVSGQEEIGHFPLSQAGNPTINARLLLDET